MQDYRALHVWRRAHRLTLDVYRVTRAPRRRGYSALISQMQRAAVSIGANIAEGCGRDGAREFAHFLQIAAASAHELEYQLLLARELTLLPTADALRLEANATSVKRMLSALIRKVRTRAPSSQCASSGTEPDPPPTDHRPP